MTPAQAAMLLAIAASFDRRKPDEVAAQGWARALEGYSFEDCREAIVEHYSTTREWLMPADVIRIVKRVRAARIQAVGYVEPPRELDGDPARENEWTRALKAAAGDGLERDDAIAAANQAQGIDPRPLELVPFNFAGAARQIASRRPTGVRVTTPTPPTAARREDEK